MKRLASGTASLIAAACWISAAVAAPNVSPHGDPTGSSPGAYDATPTASPPSAATAAVAWSASRGSSTVVRPTPRIWRPRRRPPSLAARESVRPAVEKRDDEDIAKLVDEATKTPPPVAAIEEVADEAARAADPVDAAEVAETESSLSASASPEEREKTLAAAHLKGRLDAIMVRVQALRRQGRTAEADRLLGEYWRLAEELKKSHASVATTASPSVEVAALENQPLSKPDPSPQPTLEPAAEPPAATVPEKPTTAAASPVPESMTAAEPEAPSDSLPRSPLAEEALKQASRRFDALTRAADHLEQSARGFADADYPDEARKVRDYAVRVHEQADQLMTSARRRYEEQAIEAREAEIRAQATRQLRIIAEEMRLDVAEQSKRYYRSAQREIAALQDEVMLLRNALRRVQNRLDEDDLPPLVP